MESMLFVLGRLAGASTIGTLGKLLHQLLCLLGIYFGFDLQALFGGFYIEYHVSPLGCFSQPRLNRKISIPIHPRASDVQRNILGN